MTADEFERWKKAAVGVGEGRHRGIRYVIYADGRIMTPVSFAAEAPAPGLNTSLFSRQEHAEQEIKRVIELSQSCERAKLTAWNEAARTAKNVAVD